MDEKAFSVTLELDSGYRFHADFGQEGIPPLLTDEPPPLGEGAGPNPARLLAVAVGNCLAASALFCLRKARVDVRALRAAVDVALARSARERLRITGIHVRLEPEVAPGDMARMGRCLELFEEFCVVTQSVRDGIDVKVEVEPVAR